MNTNPYESPAITEEQQVASADPLRWPALGCLVSGIVMLAVSVIGFLVAQVLYASTEVDPAIREYARDEIYSYGIWSMLSILALFVASSLLRRRNRWSVYLSCVFGLFICMPAPLAAIILFRMRKKEVWDSFDKPTNDEEVDDVSPM